MQNLLQTTKTTSPRKSRASVRLRIVLGVIAVAVLLLYAKSMLSSIAAFVTFPIYEIRQYIANSSATIPTYLRERGTILNQIRELETTIESQRGMALALANIERENEELRVLLGVPPTERIAAGVIARPPYTPYDTLVLDQGSSAGIMLNAPVYHGAGVAVGYVRSVTTDNALVTLFSSPGIESSVFVFGPDIFARAYGQGGGVTRISIPQGLTITVGDLVVLPSLDGGILGTVDAVNSIPTDPEQHAFVTSDTPIASLRLVSIGTSPIAATTFPEARETVAEVAQNLFTFPIPESEQGLGSTTATTTDEVVSEESQQ